MNFQIVFRVIGYVLRCEAGLLALPMVVAALYQEWTVVPVFLLSIAAALMISQLLLILCRPKSTYMRPMEGFFAVAGTWLALAAVGALPFFFSGYFGNYVNCLFEAMSGFTTTGSTILTDVEVIPRGLLFWRSLLHWVGGMGILVFVLGLMPNMDPSSVQLMKAESPGPMPGKLVPKLKDTSRILYAIYLVMTLVQIVLLCIVGMPLFDSVIHALGSAGTGGFSCMNLSVGAYNNVAAEVIITVFVLLFGVNFNLYYLILRKQWTGIWENEELKLYFGIVIGATALITLNTMSSVYGGSFWEALRHASFQVGTIITTTGYGTADSTQWPLFSQMILLGLMVVGACAGSTGGGIKVSRLLILCKTIKKEISRILHPNLIKSIKTEGRSVPNSVVRNVLVFFFVYTMIIGISILLISLDGYDFTTTTTAVFATINNIGPGLGQVGPLGNYSIFSDFSKLVMTFCMWAGRLEIFPVLIMFSPSIWRREF